MATYKAFVFESYDFDTSRGIVSFHYQFEGGPRFTETIHIPNVPERYDIHVADRVLRYAFLLSGVSYFKAYPVEHIEISPFALTQAEAVFMSHVYQRGLREFFYTNNLPLTTEVQFHYDPDMRTDDAVYSGTGALVGIGGGKDSLVGLAQASNQYDQVLTWNLGGQHYHNKLRPLVERMGTRHVHVTRTLDQQLLELNRKDARNGHIPVSAIFASIGAFLAVLFGLEAVIVSNEASADEPSAIIGGEPINHQWSKSSDFESRFNTLIGARTKGGLQYRSIIRHMHELDIAREFVQTGLFERYKDVFYSCNQAYRMHVDEAYWCGECAKCAFVFLMLTPYVRREELENVFGGNALLNPANTQHYLEMLGATEQKPLDCIGTVEETRQAMQQALTIYPELSSTFGSVLR